jgi:hypothetical protein
MKVQRLQKWKRYPTIVKVRCDVVLYSPTNESDSELHYSVFCDGNYKACSVYSFVLIVLINDLFIDLVRDHY